MFNFNSQNKCASNLRKIGSLQDMLPANLFVICLFCEFYIIGII